MSTTPSTPTSPKVIAGATWGWNATTFLTILSMATPDTFAALGKWQYPVFGLVTLAASVLGGYFKSDPLRKADPANAVPDTAVAVVDELAQRIGRHQSDNQ